MSSLDDLVLKFDLMNQQMSNLYESNTSSVEKWNNVAIHLNNDRDLIIKIYNAIKNNEIKNQINLDYTIKYRDLKKIIADEFNTFRKISFIILSLHIMIYDLLSQEGNYYLSLNGKEEMTIMDENIVYYVNLNIKRDQNFYFHAFILLYCLESLFNKYFYIGIDFEFTLRRNQLAQLNFEHSNVLTSIIMLVKPTEFDPILLETFVDLILCNQHIKKILHGSDSLDLPFVYSELLSKEPKKIIKFTKTMIDTRFLCEYYKLNKSEIYDNKCSIYDVDPSRSALFYFKVITETQQKNLSDLIESLPPPNDIKWDTYKLPKSQILYAQYDVLFLKHFYYKIINIATKDEDSDVQKKNIMILYQNILTELTQFVYLENNGITFLRDKCKEEVDVVNNYFIKKKGEIIKMVDINNQISVGLVTNYVDIDKIIKVNHFKKTVLTIIKRIIYGHISQKCHVFKDKNTVWVDKLYNRIIVDFFEENKFKCLQIVFKELDEIIGIKMKSYCS